IRERSHRTQRVPAVEAREGLDLDVVAEDESGQAPRPALGRQEDLPVLETALESVVGLDHMTHGDLHGDGWRSGPLRVRRRRSPAPDLFEMVSGGGYPAAVAARFLGARESVNFLYAAHTSLASPSITSRPSCTHSTREHMDWIVASEWLTRKTVPAASRTSSIFAFDFARNAASPVARASSIMRMSGMAEAEMENRSRAPIPDEEDFIGRLTKSPISAKSTISWNFPLTSSFDRPSASAPIMTLRSPVRSFISTAVTPSSAGLPATWTVPATGGMRPAMARSRVDFPEPLMPMMPMASPWRAAKLIPRTALTSRTGGCLAPRRSRRPSTPQSFVGPCPTFFAPKTR